MLHALAAACLAATLGGCSTSSNRWVSLRTTPRNPLTDTLGLVTRQGPKPTERTMQLLRRYDMVGRLQGDRAALLAEIEAIDRREPNREHAYAQAELAYVGAKKAETAMKTDEALKLYGASVLHAYRYLFADGYAATSNPYDPQFRRACDLYNGALEGTLRIVRAGGKLSPGTTHMLHAADGDCQIEVVLRSNGWHADDIDHIEFVSDYEVHGLRNHYHNFGLGVPLIAVRRHHEGADPDEAFYPPDLSFPVTAFLRIESDALRERPPVQGPSLAATATTKLPQPVTRAVLELYDPLEATSVAVAEAKVPLETDLSTPLAHFLSQPALDDDRVSTLGLLKPEKVAQLTGLYMLEPYRPDKIPVVMVHGLWSSPVTWMEMFNDLRSDPYLRDYYQFWFYLYPTGQPFWYSAGRMREDLAVMRQTLDPARREPALDQMVLVGHSMGGLVSKLQTVDSRDAFWKTVSEKPFAELQAEEAQRKELANAFFFDPNPSVRRVVTIGTPHRGSEFSNDLTRWLSQKLIRIPAQMLQGRNELFARNPGYFRNESALKINTSIDSLSPSSPILPVLLAADPGPWVRYHNVVGQAPRDGLTNKVSMWIAGEGDGVVSLVSGEVESAASQIVVPADHQSVHRHPQSILEVRRVLLEHLDDLRKHPSGTGVRFASSGEANSETGLPEAGSPWQGVPVAVPAARPYVGSSTGGEVYGPAPAVLR
ncbi:MAG: alpha/beta fold hydrolase [Pirellulales bacterium]|nr:alpha/beta fold hydrolase [Pirellulales bacterium]